MAADLASADFYSPRTVHHPPTSRFVFATGIDCSTPVIAGPDGLVRRDPDGGMRALCALLDDLRLARVLGATHLRYGPFSITGGMV
jgi:hypothetical protein